MRTMEATTKAKLQAFTDGVNAYLAFLKTNPTLIPGEYAQVPGPATPNDIPNWEYHRLPDLLGGGWGFEVRTEGDLEKALGAALANRDRFSLLNIHLEKTDVSPALERLAKWLAKRI